MFGVGVVCLVVSCFVEFLILVVYFKLRFIAYLWWVLLFDLWF